jgi:hypothetical protein
MQMTVDCAAVKVSSSENLAGPQRERQGKIAGYADAQNKTP